MDNIYNNIKIINHSYAIKKLRNIDSAVFEGLVGFYTCALCKEFALCLYFSTRIKTKVLIINDKWRFRSQVRQSNLKMALID